MHLALVEILSRVSLVHAILKIAGSLLHNNRIHRSSALVSEDALMSRPIILILLAGLLFVPEGRADIRKDVKSAKQVLEAAFKSGDASIIRQRTTADHLSITTRFQFFSQADQLKALSEYRLSSYEMAGLQVNVLTNDVALLTFRADIEGTFRGRKLPSHVQVVETWVRRDGKWLQASYQATPLGESED